ncbi:putative AMP-dependent synthetase/ligase domain-containing protein [Seiridium cardinale]
MTAEEDTSPPTIWSTIINTKAREIPGTVFCEILEHDWREKGSRKITVGQDLYTLHPTKPYLLQYRSRKDDLVKLVWLTKVRAGDMESALSSDVRITEAMGGGEGRPTPFIILQLAESIERPSEEELWTTVRTLNEKFSAEVHIPRENILVANPGRPLRKLGKGTLDRRAILADYEKDIPGVYDTANGINGSVK